MKKLLLMIIVGLLSCVYASAQQFEAPSRKTSTEVYADTTTTYTYKIKTNTYKVYKSKTGAFYIWKKSSKSGKLYKYYLPKDIQIKMGRKYNK